MFSDVPSKILLLRNAYDTDCKEMIFHQSVILSVYSNVPFVRKPCNTDCVYYLMERYGQYGKDDENIDTRVAYALGFISSSFGIQF